jgi:putative addiction module antidote
MIKQLRKVGNSNALLIDKAMMEEVGLKEGDTVQVVVKNGSLVVSPTDTTRVSREKLNAIINDIGTRRAKVLKKLAE